MKPISTGFADVVHLRAGHPSILRTVSVGDNGSLGNVVLPQSVVGGAGLIVETVRLDDVCSVEREQHRAEGQPVDVEVIVPTAYVDANPWRGKRDVGNIAAIHGRAFYILQVVIGEGVSVFRLQKFIGRLDLNSLLHGLY